MRNHGLLVATPDGIFYIAEDFRSSRSELGHLSLLSFDREVTTKYAADPNLRSLQIKEYLHFRNTLGMYFDCRSQLENAKYSLKGNVLLIELTDFVLLVQYEFNPSSDRPQCLKQVIVTQLTKEEGHSFSMLSEKKCLLVFHKACELMLGRYHERSRKLNLMMHTENEKIAPADTDKTDIISSVKIRSATTSITNIAKFSAKQHEWDYAVSIAGDREDFLGLIQDGIRATLGKPTPIETGTKFSLYKNFGEEKFNPESAIQAYTIASLKDGKQPKYFRTNKKLGLDELSSEVNIPTVFDPNDPIVDIFNLPSRSLFVQVGLRNMLIRSPDNDLHRELKHQTLRVQIVHEFLFILEDSLTLKVFRLDRSSETAEIFCDQLGELPQAFSNTVTAFHINRDILTVASAEGNLHIFRLYFSNNTILFKELFYTNCTTGSAVLKPYLSSKRTKVEAQHHTSTSKMIEEEIADLGAGRAEMDLEQLSQGEEWRSITDPTWQLTFPTVAYSNRILVTDLTLIQFGNPNSPIFLFIRLSTNDFLVYKTIGLNNREEIVSLKRLTFAIPLNTKLNDNLELDQQLKASKSDKEYSSIISNLLMSTYLDLATLPSEGKFVISSPQLKTLLWSHINGELSVHVIRDSADKGVMLNERVCGSGTNCLLFWDQSNLRVGYFAAAEGMLLDLGVGLMLRRCKDKDPIQRISVIEKDKLAGVVVMCKPRIPHAAYNMALFDLTSRDWSDRIELQRSERPTGMTKLNLENRSMEMEEVLCVMVIAIQSNQTGSKFHAKCKFYRFSKTRGMTEGSRQLKFDNPEEQNAGDHPNQLLTAVFNIQQLLFMVFESKIIQLKQFSDTYHESHRYETNASCIVDVHVIQEKYVLMTNVKGSVLLYVWDSDPNRLKKVGEYNFGAVALTEGKFLDSLRSKMVVTDHKKTVHVMSLVKDEQPGDPDEKTKLCRQQRVKLTARVFSMDLSKAENGRVLARANGGIDAVAARRVGSAVDKLTAAHRLLGVELPFFSGVSPLAQLNCEMAQGSRLLTAEPVAMDPDEVLLDALLLAYSYLSLPLQLKIAASVGLKRTEAFSLFADALDA